MHVEAIAPVGVLLIDKPRDYSSHDIINIARKALQTRKIGHSGTLDPMATGLLVLLVGREATKKQDYFQKLPKTYVATLKLGVETDSWDAYGEETLHRPIPPHTLAQISAATQDLTGAVLQPIPFFSAKKINGKRMYQIARKGQEMTRTYNTITVHGWTDLQLVSADEIRFTLSCSCGTYVRALAWMLAQKLGTTGHVTQLRRVQTGGLHADQAIDGAKLKELTREEVLNLLQPIP